MRFPRLTALAAATVTVATLTVATVGTLAAVPARADDSGPTITSVTYKAATNASLVVAVEVTNGSASPNGLEIGVADDAGTEVDTSATTVSSSAAGYSASAIVNTSGFPDGDTLYVGADAEDVNGGEDTYEDDSRPVVVDRTPPQVAISGGGTQIGTTIDLPFTVSDNQPGVTTTCTFAGGVSTSCEGSADLANTSLGQQTVTVKATDVAGNIAYAHTSLTVEQSTAMRAGLGFPTMGVGAFDDLRILVEGTVGSGVAPTGNVTVSEGGTQIAVEPLMPTYTTGVSSADVEIQGGGVGLHTLQVSYSGDSVSTPSSTTATYTALPTLRAIVKPGKSLRGRLEFTVSCPAGTTGCFGFLQLGKSKAHYQLASGRQEVLSLVLPMSVTKALKAHRRLTVKVLFADLFKHSAIVVRL